MGQRTAIIIVSKDPDHKTVVRSYHDQWGIGRKMPMALMSLFFRLYNRQYGTKLTDISYLDPRQHNIHLEYVAEYGGPNGRLKKFTEAWDEDKPTEYKPTDAVFKKLFTSVPKTAKGWDDPATVGKFVYHHHDNNNGALVVYVTRGANEDWGTPTVKYGWLLGTEDAYDMPEPPLSRWFTTEEFLTLPINVDYADTEFRNIFKGFLDYFEVEEVGKPQGEPIGAKESKSDTASE